MQFLLYLFYPSCLILLKKFYNAARAVISKTNRARFINQIHSSNTLMTFKPDFIKSRQLAFRIPLVPLVLCFLWLGRSSSAQVNDINLEHILTDKGLSQNTIHCILQDSKGFLWFATEDGLDKYDGYNFKVYKNDPHDPYSIPDNFIWTLYEDSEGTLWVGTNSGGLCRFDRETERFTRYKHNPDDPGSISYNNVRAILEDTTGVLWIGTEGGGLNKFERNKNIFVHYFHDPKDPNSLSDNVVLSLFKDSRGNLWVGSDGGLDHYNRASNNFTGYSFRKGDPGSISNNVVLCINQDTSGAIWVGTVNGLNEFNPGAGDFTRYYISSSGGGNLSSDRINSIIVDRLGVLWVATGGGIYHLWKNGRKFIDLNESKYNPNNFNNNNVLSLYEDNSGLVWIGTAEGGIVKFDRERLKFRHYKHDPANSNSLSYNTVRALFQDKSGILWVGTLGGGLDRFDMRKGRFTHFTHKANDKSSLSDNQISSIYRDSRGTLWIGTWSGGLDRMVEDNYGNPGLVKFVRYVHNASDPGSISSNLVQSVYEDSRNRLWIGTGSGLDLFDEKRGDFINFVNNPGDPNSLSNNMVQSCLMEGSSGYLWIGTWDGLNKLNISRKFSRGQASPRFIHYHHLANNPFSLSDNRVISIFKDSSGNLWLGTYGGGLNKLTLEQQNVKNPSEAHFIHYSVKEGLASNIIYGIQTDGSGNLWLSTDNGLSKLDPATGTIRNYFESDGLQGNQFYWGASLRGLYGELFFGGTNGFTAFYPSTLETNTHVPPVVITDFQIFNKPVDIDGEDSPLHRAITQTRSITLSYNQNVFSFEYAALDFTSPTKNQYKYMMVGFDKGWTDAGNRRYVTYTNLDPGEYTFKVIGSNNDGIWNDKGASIRLTILPPFWRTWWFILSSVLIGGGMIVFFITYRVRHLLDIERFRTKLAADLHDNIGASLTEISILSEVISQRLNSVSDDVKKSLNMISDNSRNLIDNMSDIVWLVNPRRDSLYDLILRLRDTYSELSSYTSISFRSENLKSLEKVSLSLEHRQHLYLIFKEGINNCITHSECSEISLDAFVKGKKLEMILKDNGAGFDQSEISNGNGLDNMKRRAENMGGKLEIVSSKGQGTTIHFIGFIL